MSDDVSVRDTTRPFVCVSVRLICPSAVAMVNDAVIASMMLDTYASMLLFATSLLLADASDGNLASMDVSN